MRHPATRQPEAFTYWDEEAPAAVLRALAGLDGAVLSLGHLIERAGLVDTRCARGAVGRWCSSEAGRAELARHGWRYFPPARLSTPSREGKPRPLGAACVVPWGTEACRWLAEDGRQVAG